MQALKSTDYLEKAEFGSALLTDKTVSVLLFAIMTLPKRSTIAIGHL